MIFNGKLYDVLKYVALIMLPAIATLYLALAQFWKLPSEDEVVGTIVVLDTFLGSMLQISTVKYNKSEAKYDGAIDVVETPDKKTFVLAFNGDPNDLDKQKQVILKVKPSS